MRRVVVRRREDDDMVEDLLDIENYETEVRRWFGELDDSSRRISAR